MARDAATICTWCHEPSHDRDACPQLRAANEAVERVRARDAANGCVKHGREDCDECYLDVVLEREPAAANVMQRYDLVELLRELTERVDGMSEPEITLGTGDDACVMDWHAFDGNFYRATIERIEP